MAVSAEGQFVVSGSRDKTIKLWNFAERGEEDIAAEITYTDYVTTVSAGGQFIASRSRDNKIQIWNTQERREEFTFSDLMPPIQRIIISADGKYIISKNDDCTVKIWNVKNKKKERFSLKLHEGLLKYILEILEIVNCEVVSTLDLLVLRSDFGIVRTASIHSEDLRFYFDLGANTSKKIIDHSSFACYIRTKTESLTMIGSEFADRYNGVLRFSLAHYFSYSGITFKLKLLFENANFVIALDAFLKSPFYYAIVKKRQDCIDVLLEKIELMRLQDPKNYELSIRAIRNDIPLIIKNSPRQLHQLLLGLISSSSLIYAKIPENLPILQSSFTKPHIDDFISIESEDIQVILQHSIVPLIGENGCMHNAALLDGIINCKQSQALRSPIINYIVTLQFNAIIYWVIVYTFLLCVNIILLMFLIGLKSFNIYLVLPFLLVNALLLAWEMI